VEASILVTTQAQSGKGTEAQRHRGTEAQRFFLLLCAFAALCLCAW